MAGHQGTRGIRWAITRHSERYRTGAGMLRNLDQRVAFARLSRGPQDITQFSQSTQLSHTSYRQTMTLGRRSRPDRRV